MAIAMTFDDGPNPHATPKLLDLLDQLNLRVTFFVLGERVKANPAILKRIAARHEIGNHTWSHKAFACLSDEKIREELRTTHKAIEEASGVTPRCNARCAFRNVDWSASSASSREPSLLTQNPKIWPE